jgi:hypothetical protein
MLYEEKKVEFNECGRASNIGNRLQRSNLSNQLSLQLIEGQFRNKSVELGKESKTVAHR